MKFFNAGALRQVMGSVDSSFAEDLVTKTLSQHGLVPGQPSGTSQAHMPVADLLAGLKPTASNTAPLHLNCPEGASFTTETFRCAEGSREYLIYVPSSAKDRPTGIVLMLHGCTQTHGDFATGTKMNRLAERDGFIVLYPQQARGENAQTCWNWFRRGDQMRDRGEPAILAGLTWQAMQRHGVPPQRTFVAGLSAGAAMAVIMGQTYPDIFAAVGAHSGLPFGAAKDVPSAFAAMAGKAITSATHPTEATPRTIVFHGADDKTVHPINAERIIEQADASGPYQTVVTDESGQAAGRSFRRQVNSAADGKPVSEIWIIDGLGHAWSGGDARGTYTNAAGPDASAEMVRFFFS